MVRKRFGWDCWGACGRNGSGGVTLAQPKRWGENVTFTWYAPGQDGGLVLKPEEHRDCYRLTIPQLGVWGVVEVRARAK